MQRFWKVRYHFAYYGPSYIVVAAVLGIAMVVLYGLRHEERFMERCHARGGVVFEAGARLQCVTGPVRPVGGL